MAERKKFKASTTACNLINNLPSEILVDIASNLSVKDLISFGLTCKYCNDISSFVKDRRGPQVLLIKLHQGFENHNCSCFMPVLLKYDCLEENILALQESNSNGVHSLCDDPGPAEEILKELLYCEPQCVIILGTHSIASESRIVNHKIKRRFSKESCSWLVVETFGFKKGSKEIPYASGNLIGLFFPGDSRDFKKLTNSQLKGKQAEKEGSKLFSIKTSGPPSYSIRRLYQCDVFLLEEFEKIFLSPYVDSLLIDSLKRYDSITSEINNVENSIPGPTGINFIILIFFSHLAGVDQFLKLFFEDVYSRYLPKLERFSVYGIELMNNMNLDVNFNAFQPHSFVEISPLTFVTLSRINTSRTFWTIGTIDLFADENAQKESMIKDKQKLNCDYIDFVDAKRTPSMRLSMLGLCSIPADTWIKSTELVEKNLKEVYPSIDFTYTLRGRNFGQISFDERIPGRTFIEKQDNWFAEKTDVSYGNQANYFVMITKDA